MRFEFATTQRIIFGVGSIAEAPSLVSPLGKRVFLLTDSLERAEPLQEGLRRAGLEVVVELVVGEPTVDSVVVATRKGREAHCEVIIGLGGGSTLDTGKAVAALLANPGELLDYLEIIGKGQPLSAPPLPYLAIPTTAGTGSEVTRNAVIASPNHKVKVSLRSPFMLPRFAIIDPQLALSLPPAITAATGMDALTQLIEPFVSHAANPLTDAFCREGLMRAARALPQAYHHGEDLKARQEMSLASLFGGLALANARLGAVHGLAGPIGGMFPAPHGAICARLLPFVVEANLRALRQRQPDSPAIRRYQETASLLTGKPEANAEESVDWLFRLIEELHIPSLSTYGIKPADFPIIAEQALQASSMKGNPIALGREDLIHILAAATT